jgi:hypothetical protein
MSFWDWLRPKPPRTSEADRIWLTKTVKLAGLATEVAAAVGPVLVLAHFPHSLREVQEALTGVGFPGETLGGVLGPAEVLQRLSGSGPGTPVYALVSQLRPGDTSTSEDERTLQVYVAERHFLREHDDRVKQFADALGPKIAITFFLSLDEPLMRAFAGGWVTDVLRRLGIRETEAIESAMVQRRIEAAQRKYAASAQGDEKSESAEEWLERFGA